jgi:hypothetical protein
MHDLEAPVACATDHGLELLDQVSLQADKPLTGPAPALDRSSIPDASFLVDQALDLVFDRLPGRAG